MGGLGGEKLSRHRVLPKCMQWNPAQSAALVYAVEFNICQENVVHPT